MKKIISLFGLLLIVCFLAVTPCINVAGQLTVKLYEEPTSDSNLGVYFVHPTAGAYRSAIALIFKPTTAGNVTSASLYLAATSTKPDGYVTVRLYNVTGDGATHTAVPDAVIENSSTSILSSTLTLASAYKAFVFSGTTELDTSTYYALQLEVENGTDYSTRCVSWGYDTVASTTDYSTYYVAGGYTVEETRIPTVTIYGYLPAGVTPTPTPASGDGGDADMEALVAVILPWLVPLLICLIPALLGYKFVGELGFFIGLNVGCILAYVTLAGTAYAFPLWGIILVGVMDVAVVLMRR